MRKRNSHSPKNVQQAQTQQQDTKYLTQKRRVFAAFFEQPKTMLMVATETGIYRANICRYIDDWQEENRIQVIEKGICKISKHPAGYYTTDPDKFIPIVEPCNTEER